MSSLSIKELYEGKATTIKGKEYYNTEKYTKPFIDKVTSLGAKQLIIKAQPQDQMTRLPDGSWGVTFNKVHILAVMGDDLYSEALGFCYALDVRKPVAKFYKCLYNTSSGNIIGVDDSDRITQAIEPEEILSYRCVEELMSKTSNYNVFIDKLESQELNTQVMDTLLGSWVRGCVSEIYGDEFGKIKVSPKDAINTYLNLCKNRDSEYYLVDTNTFSKLHLLETFIDNITKDDKDIMNKFEKSLIIQNIIR